MNLRTVHDAIHPLTKKNLRSARAEDVLKVTIANAASKSLVKGAQSNFSLVKRSSTLWLGHSSHKRGMQQK